MTEKAKEKIAAGIRDAISHAENMGPGKHPSLDEENPQPLKSDLLRGAKAAADYTGLPQTIVYRLAANGDLPVIRKGRAMFFRKSELDAAFRSGTGDGEA